MRLKPRNGKADEACERRDSRNLDRPLRESMPLEMSRDAIRDGIALGLS